MLHYLNILKFMIFSTLKTGYILLFCAIVLIGLLALVTKITNKKYWLKKVIDRI